MVTLKGVGEVRNLYYFGNLSVNLEYFKIESFFFLNYHLQRADRINGISETRARCYFFKEPKKRSKNLKYANKV